MKKTVQFLFALCIIFEGYGSYAAPNPVISMESKTDRMITPIKGLEPLIITVLDENNNPLAGVDVSAPCTGMPDMVTDQYGNATFNINGSCACSGSLATIATSVCQEKIPIICSGPNIAVCR